MARKAAAMGFDGIQVIHPSQVAETRSASVPSDEDGRTQVNEITTFSSIAV
jgi:citrate lyase beta subunit